MEFKEQPWHTEGYYKLASALIYIALQDESKDLSDAFDLIVKCGKQIRRENHFPKCSHVEVHYGYNFAETQTTHEFCDSDGVIACAKCGGLVCTHHETEHSRDCKGRKFHRA